MDIIDDDNDMRKTVERLAFLFLENCVSSSYVKNIHENIIDDVFEDVCECADPLMFNDDDVRLAIGRVLSKRLGVEV